VGTPVVALDVAGTSEVVRPDETGLLVNEGQPRELARAIARLADDAALQGRLSQGARLFAAQHFLGWEEKVRREIDLVDALVAGEAS
jgi:glycosyltransferase involved in cell wall biosynthesis